APVVPNCTFSGNLAASGGGMSNADAEPTLTNCSFSGNFSNGDGSGMYNSFSFPVVTNCIFWGDAGEEIENVFSSSTVQYSIVQGGYPGTGNLNANPLFISQPDYNVAPTTSGNLRLQACSPAAEAGSDAANSTTTDLDGNPRKVDAITGGAMIDMGAFEYQGDLDADNDTYTYCGGIDCNDSNAAIHPGAAEICNGLDDDCDTQIDEGVLLTFYQDADGDTYGNPAIPTQACNAPSGYVSNDGDCDDANAAIHPGAPEICNNLDDDCNGSPESAATTWTGAGDGVNWSDGGNWSDGFVPLTCQDVIIPATGNVTVPAGFTAVGRTLDVALGGILTVALTGILDIDN
ncbi:MAG: putative metal-binding motif-containing protein, partial [Bacteroidota bacterium]